MSAISIRKLRLLLATAFCLGHLLPAFAQDDPWRTLSGTVFEHLGLSNGLPNSMVTAVAEDGAGFLWVGTASGLARWDGYRFRVYAAGRENGEAIPDDFIQCLHTSPDGRLWAGLNAGGLARYDRALDRFVVVPLDPDYPDRVVNTIADDGAGGLWIGTDAGLEHLAAGAAAAAHALRSAADPGGPQNQQIKVLLRSRNGTLWVGTSAGLYRLDHDTGRYSLVSIPVALGRSHLEISALFEDSEGGIWIGTLTQGGFVLVPGETAPRAVHADGEVGSKIEGQRVVAIGEAEPGQIWFSIDGHGIVVLDTRTGHARHLRHDPARPTSLQHDEVWTLYRDRSGQMWVGSQAGLDRYDPGRTAISTIFGGNNGAGNLSKQDVRAVLPVDGRQIWLGYSDQGIDIVKPAEGSVVGLGARADAAARPLPDAVVFALAAAPGGKVYAATQRGLYRIEETRGATRVAVSPEKPDMDLAALIAPGEILWIGARNDGLWQYVDGSHSRGRRIGLAGLTDQRIRALEPASGGRLWVGTRNGLNLVDPASETIERILPDSHDPQSLSAGLVSSLLTDRQGRLWVATEGGGIDLLERRDPDGRPRFRHFGVAQGIPHANVDKLLMDKSGRIWASTDDGLASIDPDNFAVRSFRRAEGVAIATYWINSGGVTGQGDLLFGGIGGLTVVHPDRVSDWSYVPPIVVTDLRIGGKSVPPGRFIGAGTAEPMIVQPEADSLAVEFAALDFSAPERNRYAYKLEGFDSSWIETDSSRRLASYTNLPPGTYKLRLRGSNRNGVWAETSLDLPIRVLPAWYQTIWFRLLLVVLAAVLVMLLVRSRTAYYRGRQERLERQVELRTAELISRTGQVKALLDNSGQGFLSFGEDLIVDSEYSHACETMLGLAPAGMRVDQALFSSDEKQAELFRRAAEAFRECQDYKRRTVLLSLFPKEIRRGGLMIEAAYRRIGNGRLMAILTDVTESRRLTEKLETNYRRQDMVVAAVIESRDFFATVDSYRHFIDVQLPGWLARDDMPDALLAEIFRTVHTFKGVLGQFNFERSPKALHELEEVLADFAAAAGSETVEMLQAVVDLAQFRRCLSLDLAVVEGVLGSDFVQNGARIAVPAALAEGVSRLGARLLEGGSVDLADPAERDLLWELSRMHHVSLDRVLHGFDRMVRQLAESQGKAVAPLAVEGGEDLLVDPRRYRDFFQALVHVFRNAVSHGIETPDDRVDAGKDEAGMILCTVTRDSGAVTIAIADDGAGIDLDRLRHRLPVGLSDDAVMQSVFQDSVSAQDEVDEISGRGIGLGAVWQAVEILGGSAAVASTPGRGTVFKFTLPMDAGISMA